MCNAITGQMSTPPSPPPLTQLGRYEITRVLGQGAMGVVYAATDPVLSRTVAIKTILRSQMLDPTVAADSSARFIREAQAVARLTHPNIVTVFDFGEQGDVAYIVMEFILGRELKDYFDEDEFFDLPKAVAVMCELLDALGYAHAKGVVHRDVKPANVMIDEQGRVKLTDFGVARLADSNLDRTLAGTMVGTLSYMSPEQIQGLAVGSRADLFAAGIILYQFLTRTRPFPGPGQWTMQHQIVNESPKPPSLANRAIPAAFDAVVARAMAKDPQQRYATAAEFSADLKRVLACESQGFDPEATRIRRPDGPLADATVAPAGAPAGLGGESAKGAAPAASNDGLEDRLDLRAGAQPARQQDAEPRQEEVRVEQAQSAHGRPSETPLSGVAAPRRRFGLGAALAAGLAMAALGIFLALVQSPAELPAAAAPDTPAPVAQPKAEAVPLAPAIPAAAPAAVLSPEIPAATPALAPQPAAVPLPASQRESVSPVAPKRDVLNALGENSGVPAATAGGKVEPVGKPASAATSVAVAKEPRVSPRAAARAATSARCDAFLQRFQLGERLSAEELASFQKECK